MKYGLYAQSNFIDKVDLFVEGSEVKNRSELIVKALEFYIDYVNNKEPGAFLAREIESIIEGNIELSEKRLARVFSKQLSNVAIEFGIQQQMFKGIITNLTEEDIAKFRKIAVSEIRNSKGIFKYEDLIK